MTPDFIFMVLNPVGIFVPLAFSLAITLVHPQRYFRYWTLSYLLLLATIVLDVWSVLHGRPLVAAPFEAVFYLGSAWLTLLTGDALVGRRRSIRRRLAQAVVLFVAFIGLLLSGRPFETAAIPPLLYYIGSQVVLGFDLLRVPVGPAGPRQWLASFVIAAGLWDLTYPLLAQEGMLWLGFAGAGLLHLFAGTGMAIYLLTDVARELAVRNLELETLGRLQNEFLGTMSHELRTPLGAMRTATFLLGSMGPEAPADKRREVLEILGSNIERFIGLVDDILDFTKLQSGTMSYDLHPADLGELARRTAGSLAHQFEEKGLALVVDVPAEPVEAVLDARRIGQVIANLLSNALKFTPAGGRVEVRVRDAGERVVLEVRDSGIGIAPEHLERVFTKFYQVDGGAKRRAGGAGLGLAICRSIVEDGHGGHIRALSNGGPGAVFEVELPKEPPGCD